MQVPPARIGKYAGGQMPSKSKAQKRLMQFALAGGLINR
jgi:hypothetical protein